MLYLSLLAIYASCHSTAPSTHRWISSTPHLSASWMDKIKGLFTGSWGVASAETSDSFTLIRFVEKMNKAKKLKQFVVGKGSEAKFADTFEK
ncbi:Unknown protein [Striga hermonthica]|uniref:Uncharacterized protein n=1 Tax=Striga hermonthica TaxID=68872 RepID=A0A9N7NQR6_STRHE|nr:Unknown protein [Striga hermonthica]